MLPWEDFVPLLVKNYIDGSDFDNEFQRCVPDLTNELIELPSRQRSLAALVDRINRYHGDFQHATFVRWGDKTPLNSYCLQEINSVFPDAKFVHLIRDGADVVQSYLKHELVSDLESGAHRWKTAVDEC